MKVDVLLAECYNISGCS